MLTKDTKHKPPNYQFYPNYRFYDALVPVAIAAFVLMLGYLQTLVPITFSVVLVGIGLGVLSATLGYAGAAFCFRRLSDNLTSSVLLAVTPMTDPDYSRWLSETLLLTDTELVKFEQTVECEEIWVVTSDLHLDAPTSDQGSVDIGQVVRHNVRYRGMKYLYLLPDNLLVKRKVTHQLLAELSSKEASKIRMVYLSPAQWNDLPYIDGDVCTPCVRCRGMDCSNL
ncbi:MAG: hypothetical protein LC775_02035 [Acidobacteria bacterium]|nr:hypothetical protein [Acidobacteriota bacterium]